jgi:hypothetical protein
MAFSNVCRSFLIALGALGILSGCGEPVEFFPDLLDIQWEGEHIHFAADDAIEVCGGSRDFLDQHAGRLKSIRGLDVGPISYFTVPLETVRDACRNAEALACAVPTKVYASEPVIVHELVHAVRNTQEDFPLPGSKMFEEGLADLYDNRGNYIGRNRQAEGSLELPNDLESSLIQSIESPVPTYYRILASFYLSALADKYGDLAVWDFVTQTGELRDGRPLREIFEENFPESFDAFNTEFSQPTRCSEWAKTRHLLECEEDGPDIDASLDTLILRATDSGEMNCLSPEVVGPRRGEMWTTRTFDVTERIDLLFLGAVSSEDEDEEDAIREQPDEDLVYAWITKCGGGCSNSRAEMLLGDGPFLTNPVNELEPGRYLVRFVRPYDQPGYAALTLSSTPDWPFNDSGGE